MPTFTPPTTAGRLIADPAKRHRSGAHALWRHYGAWETGQTVWKDSLGVWHTALVPFQGGGVHRVFKDGVLVSETGPDEGLATAQVVYLGGHVYDITEAEATELINAGFGAGVDDIFIDGGSALGEVNDFVDSGSASSPPGDYTDGGSP
jgi:hypothetical protein